MKSQALKPSDWHHSNADLEELLALYSNLNQKTDGQFPYWSRLQEYGIELQDVIGFYEANSVTAGNPWLKPFMSIVEQVKISKKAAGYIHNRIHNSPDTQSAKCELRDQLNERLHYSEIRSGYRAVSLNDRVAIVPTTLREDRDGKYSYYPLPEWLEGAMIAYALPKLNWAEIPEQRYKLVWKKNDKQLRCAGRYMLECGIFENTESALNTFFSFFATEKGDPVIDLDRFVPQEKLVCYVPARTLGFLFQNALVVKLKCLSAGEPFWKLCEQRIITVKNKPVRNMSQNVSDNPVGKVPPQLVNYSSFIKKMIELGQPRPSKKQ